MTDALVLALLVLYFVGLAILLAAWIAPRHKKGNGCRHRF
jgi:hypothetical protein